MPLVITRRIVERRCAHRVACRERRERRGACLRTPPLSTLRRSLALPEWPVAVPDTTGVAVPPERLVLETASVDEVVVNDGLKLARSPLVRPVTLRVTEPVNPL